MEVFRLVSNSRKLPTLGKSRHLWTVSNQNKERKGWTHLSGSRSPIISDSVTETSVDEGVLTLRLEGGGGGEPLEDLRTSVRGVPGQRKGKGPCS